MLFLRSQNLRRAGCERAQHEDQAGEQVRGDSTQNDGEGGGGLEAIGAVHDEIHHRPSGDAARGEGQLRPGAVAEVAAQSGPLARGAEDAAQVQPREQGL